MTTRRIRVLIVDDSLFMRAAIAKTLAAGAFEVVGQAKDGSDALAQVGRLAPDVITMDFNMPGTDGLEVVSRIRAIQPNMPVAVVSANIQDEIIGRARELKAAFIPKPLTDEALGAFLSGAALRLKKSV